MMASPSILQQLRRADTPRRIGNVAALLVSLTDLSTSAGRVAEVRRLAASRALAGAEPDELHLWARALGAVSVGTTSTEAMRLRFAGAAVAYLARTATPDDELLHRHADGTEHAHAGSWGFIIAGQVRPDELGDSQHEHTTLHLTDTDAPPAPRSGPVVWTARHGDLEVTA